MPGFRVELLLLLEMLAGLLNDSLTTRVVNMTTT
jgi:hypothetical protein